MLGKRHRHPYLGSHSSGEAALGLYDQVAHFDHERGAFERVSLGVEQYPSEAVFVRRRGGAAENDGYLLSLVYDATTHASHVAVLDAQRIAEGPIARLFFDHHVPFTFHGNWSSAAG